MDEAVYLIIIIMNITSLSMICSLLYRGFCRKQKKTYEQDSLSIIFQDYIVFVGNFSERVNALYDIEL